MIQDKILAVDVSSSVLDSFDGSKLDHLKNTAGEIGELLDKQEAGTIVVMEATNHYHELLAEMAYRREFKVYVLNPLASHRYMSFIADDVQDDRSAAKALYRLAVRELDRYRPWKPVPERVRRLDTLVKARAKQVGLLESLVKSNHDLSRSKISIRQNDQVIRCFRKQIDALDDQIEALAKGFEIYELILSCPGVGPVFASALTCYMSMHEFDTADQLVASLGLAVKKRRSGTGPEARYLSKRGDGYLRSLAHMSGRAASRSRLFRDDYAALRARGLAPKEAFITLGRRILRIVFAVVRDKKSFDEKSLLKVRVARTRDQALVSAEIDSICST